MEGLPVFDDLPGRHAKLKAAFEKLDPKLRVPTQAIGRRYSIGCVAVEITQRCNLDCTLCYLSESSEKVKDIPLPLVLERLRRVREQYGDGVSVQITGGDPTLRKRDELVAIVREAARLGLEPSLMTNGIKLTRDLARELMDAGLSDVAIHVDLTQERKGYATEESLNAIRQEYIERVRGLGLHVIFNTTVFDGNLAEIPALLRFFSKNADVVGLVSFQIQAATGRGVLTERTSAITLPNVRRRIEEACGTATRLGQHPRGPPGLQLGVLRPPREGSVPRPERGPGAPRRDHSRDDRHQVLAGQRVPHRPRVLFWALSRPAFLLPDPEPARRVHRAPRARALDGPEGDPQAHAHHPQLHGRERPRSRARRGLQLHGRDRPRLRLDVRAQRRARNVHSKAARGEDGGGREGLEPADGSDPAGPRAEAPPARVPLAALPESPPRRCPSSRGESRRDDARGPQPFRIRCQASRTASR